MNRRSLGGRSFATIAAGLMFVANAGITLAAAGNGASFTDRCNAVGVVECLAFDSESMVDRYRSTPSHIDRRDWIHWDPISNSAQFTVAPRSPADSSGMLDIPFPTPLTNLYVSFDVRYPANFLSYRFKGGGGWKMFILGQGPEGCAPYEIVGVDAYYRGFPNFYYLCGTFEPIEKQNPFGNDIDEFDLQPGGDTQCLRNGPPRTLPCARFVPDRWVTYTIHVDTVTHYLEVWQTVNGRTSQLIDFALSKLPPKPVAYSWIKLTPYNTGKDPSEEHPRFVLWYRRVVVSTKPIAFPSGDVTR